MVGTEGCLWTRAVRLDGNESSGYLVSHIAQRDTARCRVVLDCGSCTISSYESAGVVAKADRVYVRNTAAREDYHGVQACLGHIPPKHGGNDLDG